MATKIIYEGDVAAGKFLRRFALQQRDILHELMAFRDLKQDVRRIYFADGTKITCRSHFGDDEIVINVPLRELKEEIKKEEHGKNRLPIPIQQEIKLLSPTTNVLVPSLHEISGSILLVPGDKMFRKLKDVKDFSIEHIPPQYASTKAFYINNVEITDSKWTAKNWFKITGPPQTWKIVTEGSAASFDQGYYPGVIDIKVHKERLKVTYGTLSYTIFPLTFGRKFDELLWLSDYYAGVEGIPFFYAEESSGPTTVTVTTAAAPTAEGEHSSWLHDLQVGFAWVPDLWEDATGKFQPAIGEGGSAKYHYKNTGGNWWAEIPESCPDHGGETLPTIWGSSTHPDEKYESSWVSYSVKSDGTSNARYYEALVTGDTGYRNTDWPTGSQTGCGDPEEYMVPVSVPANSESSSSILPVHLSEVDFRFKPSDSELWSLLQKFGYKTEEDWDSSKYKVTIDYSVAAVDPLCD